MSHKRRHAQAFQDEDHDGAQDKTSRPEDQQDVPVDANRNNKEREIWDAFREEHYEAIEQLPLSLHRQFILMKELDQQAHAYDSDILLTLWKYISLRRSMASRHGSHLSERLSADSSIPNGSRVLQDGPSDTSLVPSTPLDVTVFPSISLGDTSPSLRGQLGSTSPTKGSPNTPQPSGKVYVTSIATPRTSTPASILPERVKTLLTTREMLSRIGWLSEELLRASEEKVNLAQAGYDSVDRHIRLLDQAIKEQEASISLGVRSGTHLAPILLPDLVVPRWARPSRVTLSPMPTHPSEADGECQQDESAMQNVGYGGATVVTMSSQKPDESRVKKGKKGRGKWPRKKVEQEPLVDVAEPPRRGVRSLKLTVSTPAPVAVMPPADPDEKRYCYCDQISFGEMIACDRKGCERDWFHWSCAGITKAPSNKSKWYCRDCSALMRGQRK